MNSKRKTQPKIDPRFTRYRLLVRPSCIHGLGVFCGQNISPRKRVIEYAGELISARESMRRLSAAGRPKRILVAALNRRWRVDAIRGGSGAEYINHSCDPNLFVRKTAQRIFLLSRRFIRRAEELTVDYHLSRDGNRIPCRCGSTKCRGSLSRA